MDHVFLQVVDPRPENRPQQRVGHVVESKTLISVKKLPIFLYGKWGGLEDRSRALGLLRLA